MIFSAVCLCQTTLHHADDSHLVQALWKQANKQTKKIFSISSSGCSVGLRWKVAECVETPQTLEAVSQVSSSLLTNTTFLLQAQQLPTWALNSNMNAEINSGLSHKKKKVQRMTSPGFWVHLWELWRWTETQKRVRRRRRRLRGNYCCLCSSAAIWQVGAAEQYEQNYLVALVVQISNIIFKACGLAYFLRFFSFHRVVMTPATLPRTTNGYKN